MTENKIPKHIALIVNGNKEWAGERNLAVENGFLRGFEVLKKVPEWLMEKGVKEISFLIFSENGEKHDRDFNCLMKLARVFFVENSDDLIKNGFRIIFSGGIDGLPGDLAEIFKQITILSKDNTGGVLNFCFNYDGREEIIGAIKSIIENGFEISQINESLVKKYLYQNDLSYPDLIVNTAGFQKISGFLLWQSAGSEFISMNKFWPDFEKTDIDSILNRYYKAINRV